jgi:hypothetical protein
MIPLIPWMTASEVAMSQARRFAAPAHGRSWHFSSDSHVGFHGSFGGVKPT